MFSEAPPSRALAQKSKQLREIERKLSEQLRELERRAQLSEQLSVATAARWSHRVRVTVIPLTLGITLGLVGALLNVLSDKRGRVTTDLGTPSTVAACLNYACVPLTLLSAPANDARAAVGCSVFFMLLLAGGAFTVLTTARNLTTAFNAMPVCGMRYHLEIRTQVYTITGVTFLLTFAVLLSRLAQHAALGWIRPITTRQLVLSSWRTVSLCDCPSDW
jgi:hypothetical protein